MLLGLSLPTYPVIVGIVVALPLLFVLSGGERSMGSRAMRPLLLLLSVQALCYYGVYLVTPLPLGWHVSTTCHRLFLHLWPAALLLGSLAAGPRPAGRFQPRSSR